MMKKQTSYVLASPEPVASLSGILLHALFVFDSPLIRRRLCSEGSPFHLVASTYSPAKLEPVASLSCNLLPQAPPAVESPSMRRRLVFDPPLVEKKCQIEGSPVAYDSPPPPLTYPPPLESTETDEYLSGLIAADTLSPWSLGPFGPADLLDDANSGGWTQVPKTEEQPVTKKKLTRFQFLK